MRLGVKLKHLRMSILLLILCIHASTTRANSVNGYVLAIQMTPVSCLNSSKVKQRKCLEGYSLNIKGLFPEVNKRDCSTSSSPVLQPLQAKVVARVMPDEVARQHLWRDIGGCVPMNASQYFRTVINYAERLSIPEVMTGQETKVVQLPALRTMFARLNSGIPHNGIHFQCSHHRGVNYLSEVKICYTASGRFKSCPTEVSTNCPNSFTIKGSY